MNLSPPALALVLVIGVVWPCLYLLGITKRWGMLVPFFLLLFASCLATPRDWADRVLPTVWFGIQSRRSEIFLGAGVAALLIVAAQFSRLSGKRLSIAAMLLVGVGIYSALLRLHHGGPADGFQSLIFAVCTLVPLLVVAPLAMDHPADARGLVRCIGLVNAVWVMMCAVQFVINSSYLSQGNQFRFVGLLGNPQHAGVLISFFAVSNLWLLLNDRGKFVRMIYTGLLGANLIMLIWTGSRTGMGMSLIGFAGVMYTRLGRSILFLPIVVIIAYVGFKAVLTVTGLNIGSDRLTTLEDTRSAAWMTLISVGMESPLFGAGTDEAERSENSWLYAFASYGIGMLFLTIVLTMVAGLEFLKAVRARVSLPLDERRVMDLSLGMIAMYFAGAVLEGYMISRVSGALPFFMIFSGMMVMMTRYAVLNRAGDLAPDGYEEDVQYEDDEHHPTMAY
jgi:hypothetical protein